MSRMFVTYMSKLVGVEVKLHGEVNDEACDRTASELMFHWTGAPPPLPHIRQGDRPPSSPSHSRTAAAPTVTPR